jgi:hypothetical protein
MSAVLLLLLCALASLLAGSDAQEYVMVLAVRGSSHMTHM